MIWFNCQKCGKKHGRPESSCGSLVFCECGQGNPVPWESTAAPEATVVAELLPPAPELAPVKFTIEPSTSPPPSRPPARSWDRDREGQGQGDRDDNRYDRPRRPPPRPRPRQRDPKICLNHPSVASLAQCADCQYGFCQDCLVQFDGQQVCGPCKNQRVKAMHRPSPISQLALASLLVALSTGPLAFCFYPVGRTFSTNTLSIWALLPQLVALVLGIWALRATEKNHRLGGKALAISAIATASFAAFWSLFLTFYAYRLMG